MRTRSKDLLCWVIALAFSIFSAPALGAIKKFDVTTPRAFGYVIGDTFKHVVRLELEKPYTLDRDALPQAGRIDPWLELRETVLGVREKKDSNVYQISLIYQVQGAPKELKRFFTPTYTLAFKDKIRSTPVIVPQWGFTVSPITTLNQKASAAFLELQPDRAPPEISLQSPVVGIVISTVGILLALLLLAYLFLVVPLFHRTNGPFAHACKELKNLQKRPRDKSLYRDALRCVHDALNQTAGKVLIAKDLNCFFSDHPRFNPLRSPFDRLFKQSEAVFFTPDDSKPDTSTCSVDWLVQLCRRCRDFERGLT